MREFRKRLDYPGGCGCYGITTYATEHVEDDPAKARIVLDIETHRCPYHQRIVEKLSKESQHE